MSEKLKISMVTYTKEEEKQAKEELAYWRTLASWLGEGWRVYGWNNKSSCLFIGPGDRSYDIGGDLAVRLMKEVKST